MAAPQANFVMQYSKQVEQLLREAGGGKVDQKLEKLMARMEKAYKGLDDINRRREWTRDQHELLAAGRQFYDEAGHQADAISRAATKMSKFPGTSRQAAEVKRLLAKWPRLRADLSRSLSALRDEKLPTAGFNSQELDPANIDGQIFTHYHGGPDGVNPATFQLTGPAGGKATIKMEHVQGSLYGGHLHSIAPQHLGTLESMLSNNFRYDSNSGVASFELAYGGSAEIRYRPSDVCTRRKFTLNMHWGDAGMGWSCRVDVRYNGRLYNLNDHNLPHMNLYTWDELHPTEGSHYGTLDLVNRLVQLNNEFGAALEAGEFDETVTHNDPLNVAFIRPRNRRIWVNDMSLPWGGLFRAHAKWTGKKGHSRHRWGDCVDISINPKNDITEKQANWLINNGPRILGVQPLNEGDHLHFRLE